MPGRSKVVTPCWPSHWGGEPADRHTYMLHWANTIGNPVKLEDDQQKDGPGGQIQDN